jgi:glycosyltransferase involved in cell wall biosynthesis
MDFLGLKKYKGKTISSGSRSVDSNAFSITKKMNERADLIGYIGRLSDEKGIMNFVEAIPLISEKQGNLKFFIGGDGPLYAKIRDRLEDNNLMEKVELKGWIPHEKVPSYLNELKLFILPSYSEGLPTAILESMACGTPVLATPVGGIPDVIDDKVTGLILEDTSPEFIAKNVIDALENANLDGISINGRALIEKQFSFTGAVERFKLIFQMPDSKSYIL